MAFHYSEEFKRRAVKLADQSSAHKAARQLGCSEPSIQNWRKKFAAEDSTDQPEVEEVESDDGVMTKKAAADLQAKLEYYSEFSRNLSEDIKRHKVIIDALVSELMSLQSGLN
jgi:transposase-like protein